MGVLGCTASFTFFKSCTKRHAASCPSTGAFLTGNIGVLHGELGHRIITPASNRELKTGVIPSIASWRNLYWGCLGLYVDLGVTTRGSTFCMQPTSYLFLAHREGGTSTNRGSSTVICGRETHDSSPRPPMASVECRASKAPLHSLRLNPVAGEKYCPTMPCGSGVQSHASPPPYSPLAQFGPMSCPGANVQD